MVLIRPYMQSFFFDCRGRTKCHGKNSPRISAFAFNTRKTRRCRKCKQPMRGHTREKCHDTLQNRCFSLPYYFFINFWFLNIQGTFSTFMLCFVELWSHCYSHMYKYDTVFFFLKNSLGDYYLFRTIRGRLYTMKHFLVKF